MELVWSAPNETRLEADLAMQDNGLIKSKWPIQGNRMESELIELRSRRILRVLKQQLI